jgi:nucleotide-binding universal stress UspA family protein
VVFARVVVGVDGTEWGFEALRQATVLAPVEGSLHAVTALDLRPVVHTGLAASHWAEVLEQEATAARDAAAAILADRSACTAKVVRGEPVQVLQQECVAVQATLLAVGGRRSSRLLGIALGDTSSQLLHDAPCSVFFARPHDEQVWEPRMIVVGFDGSEGGAAALHAAAELAARFGARLETVCATSGRSAPSGEQWAERVDTWDPAHPVGALVGRSSDVDLVVVGSRGLHGVQALGSVGERVAHHARCSVLVVREQSQTGAAAGVA